VAENMRSIFTIALALVLVIAFSLYLKAFFAPPPPILQVEDVSLNPNTINIDQIASISITIKSNDNSKSHFLRIEFESHVLVSFLLGDVNLPQENGKWYFTRTVNPSEKFTQPFNVRASLESGIAQLIYYISIKFYVDGNQFDSRTLELTVRR